MFSNVQTTFNLWLIIFGMLSSRGVTVSITFGLDRLTQFLPLIITLLKLNLGNHYVLLFHLGEFLYEKGSIGGLLELLL
jgi:hypothetical protein